jgi:hypothetical protein
MGPEEGARPVLQVEPVVVPGQVEEPGRLEAAAVQVDGKTAGCPCS